MAVKDRSPEEVLRAVSQGAGAFVALASFLAFLSEAFAIRPAQQLFHLIPIRPNLQALLAMFLGLALLCAHLPSPWARRLSQGVGAVVAVICFSVVAQILLGWRTAFGEWVYPQGFGALSGLEVQSLALPSAIELGLLGAALAYADRDRGWPADLLALTTLGYLFISGIMVALRVQHRYGTVFALPTGVVLILVLALGVLFVHPNRGVMFAITRETLVGVLLRRLIPTALLAPSLIALAWVEGQRQGVFEAPEGVFFAMLAMIVLSLALVGWNVSPLARAERARDEALQALQESEMRARRLAAIVEASDDAIMTYDSQTWVPTYWSRGASKLWGWSSEEGLRKEVGFFTQPEDRSKFLECFDDLESGRPVTFQVMKAVRRDGTQIDVSVSIFPIRDAQGQIVAFGSIQRDITEQRKMLEEVARRSAELKKSEELNQLKDHFLSTISHEMKTPLSLITGYTELLEDACPDETMLAGIKDGSRRLSEHIDNILDYSALISGTLPLYKTEVNLLEVADHVEGLMQESFQKKGISLALEADPETPVIEGDFRRIFQILVELMENAQKFTPEGGQAGIRIAPEDDHVRVEVWNTGEGISEQDFGRIWEAFSQLATEDAFRKGGLGLGLTIVKRLVELHGGRVSVASQVGQGATFTVILPVGQPEAPPGPQGGAP
jgi:PAS domain S-box-containing protein